MHAAVETAQAGGGLPKNEDLTLYAPRLMPFTDNLGAELLILEQREIDVLTTLRSNLATTRMIMDGVSSGRRSFGLLTATQIAGSIRHALQVLSEAFEHFAPDRKFSLMGNDPELATTILRRQSAGV